MSLPARLSECVSICLPERHQRVPSELKLLLQLIPFL